MVEPVNISLPSRSWLPIAGNSSLPEKSSQPSGTTFQDLLIRQLSETNDAQQTAQQAIESYEIGGDVTRTEAMIAVKKAELSMRLTMQIRNKLVEAFNEIRQMQM